MCKTAGQRKERCRAFTLNPKSGVVGPAGPAGSTLDPALDTRDLRLLLSGAAGVGPLAGVGAGGCGRVVDPGPGWWRAACS